MVCSSSVQCDVCSMQHAVCSSLQCDVCTKGRLNKKINCDHAHTEEGRRGGQQISDHTRVINRPGVAGAVLKNPL